MTKLTAAERQALADEMSRIMQDAEDVADTMTLEQVKAWAVANLTQSAVRPIMAEAYPDPKSNLEAVK